MPTPNENVPNPNESSNNPSENPEIRGNINISQQEIIKELHKLAEGGDAEAQYQLSMKYMDMPATKENSQAAYKWMKKAAEANLPQAQCRLADMYFYGRCVIANQHEGVKWYIRAAENGCAEAKCKVVSFYTYGFFKLYNLCPEIGPESLLSYVKHVAESASANVQLTFADYFFRKEDDVNAKYWYKKAANQGLAKAQFKLANMYYLGFDGERKLREAVFWFTRAADQEDVNAQHNLGMLYLEGLGVPKSSADAAYWLTKAANKHFIPSQLKLAKLYFNGDGVERDYTEALHWYTKAAERENTEAQYQLGLIYAKGLKDERRVVVQARPQIAFHWMKQAATHNVFDEHNESKRIEANFELAKMYYNGFGTDKDLRRALSHLHTAIRGGSAEAAKFLTLHQDDFDNLGH